MLQKIVKVKLSGIKWDTDEQAAPPTPLPESMTLDMERHEGETDDELFSRAVDKASDSVGWCILGIEHEEIV